MTDDPAFFVRFWGVRGSIACPGPEFARYGGNTACLEIRCGDRLLVLDGGTGLKPLGRALATEEPLAADMFFTHAHFDHLCGLPFFAPIYRDRNRFRLWSGRETGAAALGEAIDRLMSPPLFPISRDVFQAAVDFRTFAPGDPIAVADDITVRTTALNHPQGAAGYRIDYGRKSICYVTDTEHYADRLDDRILGLIDGADLMIYDATYTDEEYVDHVGWGHSTWQEGLKLCAAGDVARLALFHHDPGHDDTAMDRIAADVRAASATAVVAREGMTIAP